MILPLERAEHAFLEVLLSAFTLKRANAADGVELSVAFDDSTPAAWNRAGRDSVRDGNPRFAENAAQYQAELSQVLFGTKRCTYAHHDPAFPFRWASAGTLPVINIGAKEYYCLFFRDVYPIGWNIANGATDTTEELLNPLHALERELGEELVIIDPERERRYVLRPDKDTLLDRPEFAQFRRLWREQYPEVDLARYRVSRLPLGWEEAPDRVTVRYGRRSQRLQNCYVNINAGDFGIELDRIARITVNERLVFCDGEVTANRALNRPVGLFEVSRLQGALAKGETSFTPDWFFHSAVRRPGDGIGRFLNRVLLPEIREWRKAKDVERFASTPDRDRLRLCPVTESLMKRHMAGKHVDVAPVGGHEVFLSCAAPDHRLAAQLYDGLCRRGLRVFFAPRQESPGTWNRSIYSALASATALVSVATKVEHLQRPSPQWEIETFHMLRMHDPRARMVPVVKGFDPMALPIPLCGYPAVSATRREPERALEDVVALLRGGK